MLDFDSSKTYVPRLPASEIHYNIPSQKILDLPLYTIGHQYHTIATYVGTGSKGYLVDLIYPQILILKIWHFPSTKLVSYCKVAS